MRFKEHSNLLHSKFGSKFLMEPLVSKIGRARYLMFVL